MIIQFNKRSLLSINNIVMILFFVTLFFQVTIIKYMWSLEALSQVLNLVALFFLNLYFILGLVREQFSLKIWIFYLLPGFLVYAGMMTNIFVNVLDDVNNLSFWGLTLPWCAYLSIPLFMKRNCHFDEQLWRYYFLFMSITTALALLEYFLVFSGTGIIPLSDIETSGGTFKTGYFSIFFPIWNGVHFRLYGVFPEPGTLAMFLIPAIAYAYFYKKTILLIVMVLAVGFTLSLGAFASLLTLPFFIYLVTLKKVLSTPTLLIVFIVFVAATQIGYFQDAYENKGGSRETRTNNLQNGLAAIPEMINGQPFGATFKKPIVRGEQVSAASYTTFMPVYKFVLGGFFAFIGYFLVALIAMSVSFVSLFKKDLMLYEKVAFVSMIPLGSFLLQRTTIWESVLFALLFAPSIIRALGKTSITQLPRNNRR